MRINMPFKFQVYHATLIEIVKHFLESVVLTPVRHIVLLVRIGQTIEFEILRESLHEFAVIIRQTLPSQG